MTAYEQELQRCKVVLLLRATLAARGSMRSAAVTTGVHRNTIRRILNGAGYTAKDLRKMAKARLADTLRKPVQSVVAVNLAERRSA
jgi:GTP1/Obg family GTP-binding protein